MTSLALDVGGREVHVADSGWPQGRQAPVTLLASGLAGAWFDWAGVQALLEPHAHVIVMDRPGCGDSPPPVEPVAVDLVGCADDLVGVLDACGVGSAVLVGHSMGAWYAEAAARLHPRRVSAVVLVDGSVCEGDETAPEQDSSLVATLITAADRTVGWQWLGPLLRRLGDRGLPTGEWGRRHRERSARTYARAHVWRTIATEDAAYARLRHEMAQLRSTRPLPAIPVHAVTALAGSMPGRWSWWARQQRRQAAALSSDNPAAQVTREVIRPARHMVMLQHPHRVADAILRTSVQVRRHI